MKRNPIFVAVLAFTLVFLGGAAIAAIGTSNSPTTTPEPAALDAGTTGTTQAPSETADFGKPATNEGDKEKPKEEEKPKGPRLSILSPENGSHTEDQVIEVTGVTDEDAVVFLGDRQADQEGGEWALEVELKEGKNALTFKAFDPDGNWTKRTLFVWFGPEKDTEPPAFAVTSPKNGSETTYRVVLVRGSVEPGSKVYYGDRLAEVDGDAWKIDVELEIGKNELTFKALDEAGNKSTATLKITRIEKKDEEPTGPKFTITSPSHKSETDDKVILVKGGVTPGSKVYYGDRQAQVNGDDWKIEVELKPGWNELWFKAIDEAGNKTKASVKVYLITEDGEYEFWAAQKYGSCGEEAPYDVFYGKGKPGSVIEVGSAYGNGRVEVGKHGHWEVKVYFEGSPVGEPFKVTVYASTGETKHFTFVNTGSGGDH